MNNRDFYFRRLVVVLFSICAGFVGAQCLASGSETPTLAVPQLQNATSWGATARVVEAAFRWALHDSRGQSKAVDQ